MVLMRIPGVTVLTCVYNGEDFVSEAIESILNQSHNDFEHLIVDDGSTDRTRDIIKGYISKDGRVRLLEKPHTGLTDSLNCGLENARGTWIARLDADDIALLDRLSLQIRHVSNRDNLVLLGGACIEVDAKGTALKEHSYPQGHRELMGKLEKRQAVFPHSSVLFHKEQSLRLGGYNPRFRRSQDRDLWLRLGENGSISSLQVPVVKLRRHPRAVSNTEERLQLTLGMCAVICHFRRTSGTRDLSRGEENTWLGFSKWVEERLEELGYFAHMRGRKALRSMYHALAGNHDKLKHLTNGIRSLMRNPLGNITLLRQHPFHNLGRRLAQESVELWP
jgi:glycosyltransferase involved in cell wall biosynthesis